MALPLYLAQTALEMAGNPLSEGTAYMACHFSPGGQGLSNLPEILPTGAMLILDDSTPMNGHDRTLILKQLDQVISKLQCQSLLLDFQRKDVPGQWDLAKLLTESVPCSVGVSDIYARELSCPVFLSPVPPDRPLAEYLIPWQGREIWLEAALDGITLTLTESGCTVDSLWDFPEDGLAEKNMNCHYTIEIAADSAIFRLWRTREDLYNLLKEAESHGIRKAVGFWQELGDAFCAAP